MTMWRSRGKLVLVPAILASASLLACGGDDDGGSAADLKDQLLAPEAVAGFDLKREFEWTDPIDLTFQGLFISENTKPSEFFESVDDTGFEAGAGQDFQKKNGPGIRVVVARFDSDDGAREALELIHQEDLKQPCYGACSSRGTEFEVTGIPGAVGAQLEPIPNPPPDAPPPFSAYAVEFTDGSTLYVVNGGGPPGSIKRSQVLGTAKQLYRGVR
jgi:hypothetical protein